MARRGISMIAFPRVRTTYTYKLYIFSSTSRVCDVYAVKEVRHSWGLGQLMGACNRLLEHVLKLSRNKLLVACIELETRTTS